MPNERPASLMPARMVGPDRQARRATQRTKHPSAPDILARALHAGKEIPGTAGMFQGLPDAEKPV
jgi:hypothetical protein